MFNIEYYEAASQEWYKYGEGEYCTYSDADREIQLLMFKDHYSRKLSLRVNYQSQNITSEI
jgi:hypothetical protein